VAKNILTLSDSTFDETIGGADTPVLVDFWAEWCGPCHMIAPVLEEIAAEHEGKLQIAKVNVDDNPSTAQRFNVMSIPNLVVMKSGKVFMQQPGLVDHRQMAAWLTQAGA